ncbi:MAG: YciI family protein [Rhodomicrobiaceae bacterium]
MPHFHLRLNAPRQSFAFDMTAEESRLMQLHISYWMELIAARTAIVFGPVLDAKGPWGMAILEVADETAAREICSKDPVTQAQIGFSTESSPMQIGAVRGEPAAAAPSSQTKTN